LYLFNFTEFDSIKCKVWLYEEFTTEQNENCQATSSERGLSFMRLFAHSLDKACLEVWQKTCTFFIMRGKVNIFGTVTHQNHIHGNEQIKCGECSLQEVGWGGAGTGMSWLRIGTGDGLF
jgi:hypothetical protein